MYWLGNFSFFNWCGWNDPNTCLIEYFNASYNNDSVPRNLGITILPISFWKHFFCYSFEIGCDNKRFCLGFGFISFFIDYKE